MKTAPSYTIHSVDHALRAAVMLQLEGPLTVAEIADRLGVARSTAHRVLQMLVYRDFAAQDERRAYRPGPVLELAAHSGSQTSRLRTAALPHMERLVRTLGESANLGVLSGLTTRFIASVECTQALRVGSREGMVFPAIDTTAGMLMLAELSAEDLATLNDPDGSIRRRRGELARIRTAGFAVNLGRSEKGIVAVGVPVRDGHTVVAGFAISMPSVRYVRTELPRLVRTLKAAARGVEADLA